MVAHCFIYNRHKCFKPWNNCYCYCKVCKTYLKYCQQIFYDEINTCEDGLAIIIPLGFSLFILLVKLFIVLYNGRLEAT